MTIGADYCTDAFDLLAEAGLRVLLELAAKFTRRAPADALADLTASTTYELLRAKRYGATVAVAGAVDASWPAKFVAIVRVNRWLAMTELGPVADVAREVEAWHETATTPTDQLVGLALLGRFDRAVEVLNDMLLDKQIGWSEIANWPVLAPLLRHIYEKKITLERPRTRDHKPGRTARQPGQPRGRKPKPR